MWFHRPTDASEWHWFDMTSHGLAARGLVTGDVIRIDGVHVASIAQEVLLRRADDGVVVAPDMVPDNG